MSGRIRFLGFDKDGTLLDTASGYTHEWGKIIQRDFGLDPKTAEEIFSVEAAGIPTAVQLSLVLVRLNIKLTKEQIFKRANQIALELGENVKGDLFPDVLPAIKKLKNLGYKIFISSGQQEKVVINDLKRTAIVEYIDFIAAITPDKPDFIKGEEHFRAAAKYFNVPFKEFASEAVFIGDTPEDIKIANASGIISIVRTVMHSEKELKNAGAKYVVKNFFNLPQLIGSF